MGLPALSLATVLKASLLAGLIAGLLTAGFHFVLTEPTIEAAIGFEEAASIEHAAQGEDEQPVVSREGQRAGLFLGYILYGLAVSLLLGLAYHAGQRWLPGETIGRRAFLFALLAFAAVGLLPALKYPGSPPGVGDPATIGYRQELYLILLGLSILGAVLAVTFGLHLCRALQAGIHEWALIFGLAFLFGGGLFIALPPIVETSEIPPEIIDAFRVRSQMGSVVYWLTFAGIFAWLLRREASRAESAAGAASPAPSWHQA